MNMSLASKSSNALLAFVGLAVLLSAICLLNHAEQVSCSPVEENNDSKNKQEARNEPEPLSLFPEGQECPEGEKLVPGVLPTDEPTCENPEPLRKKIFSYSMDYVPCFCKEPMVRNKQTGKCVELKDCPKKQ